MTTIVALSCVNGIVIASDSQSTTGAIKRSQEDKIHNTRVNKNTDVIFVGSGISAYISRFIDYFEEHKKDKEIKIIRDFADRSEDMMRRLMKRYPEMEIAIISGIRLKKDDNISWGVYTLYSLGVADKIENYGCIGTGSTIAEYIISRLWFKGLTVEQGILLAIYVIDEVKKVDTYSGGLTKIVKITDEGVKYIDQLDILTGFTTIKRRDLELRNVWANTILFPEKLKKKNRKEKKQE